MPSVRWLPNTLAEELTAATSPLGPAVVREPHQTEGRPPLLLLCHRIPYPPDKGDKIRSFHLLKYLSERYEVYLATFVDDPKDWVHVATLRNFCADLYVAPLPALKSKVWSMTGFLRGLPLSVAYYENRQLREWVKSKDEQLGFTRRFVFSSAMSQFLPRERSGSRTIVDFVDVDSDKWRQYAQSRRGLMSWIFLREASLLEQWELRLARQVEGSLFVSSAEAAFFRSVSGLPEDVCGHYCNGVDAEFFDADRLETAPPAGAAEFVFTGAMDYWPNVDAVRWFAREVLPLLREDTPDVRFTVVGGNPTDAVIELSRLPGVTVTGRVEDVRPYLARATAVVAPMRVARGVQNKVLEGMAMGKAVLTTSMGLEGINAQHGSTVIVADTPEQIQSALREHSVAMLTEIGSRARDFVLKHHGWPASLAPVAAIIEGAKGND